MIIRFIMSSYTKQSSPKEESSYMSEWEEYNLTKFKKVQRMQKKQASSIRRRKIRQSKEERLWK